MQIPLPTNSLPVLRMEEIKGKNDTGCNASQAVGLGCAPRSGTPSTATPYLRVNTTPEANNSYRKGADLSATPGMQ